jgi:hypothetical protein
MGALIINTALNAGQKILRKSQSSSEVDGLVTLVESYVVRSQDVAGLEPYRNTSHSSFSGATTKYSRMFVETTRVEPLDGDLAELVVTYVGLDYASGLPPAYITVVGQPGVGVFGADASVVVKYINQDSLFATLTGSVLNLAIGGSNLVLPTKRLMPATINGTAMPPNPRQREYRRSPTLSEVAAAVNENFKRGIISSGYVSYYAPTIEYLYASYVQTGISFARRGLFNQIEEQFTEYFRGTGEFYTSDGIINIPRVKSFNRGYNFTF